MTHAGSRGLRVFLTVWLGQFVSTIGSSLTGFALGVWVYQRTGSATQFAILTLFATLPGIVVAPLAGALVDRWDRRKTMLLADTGAALGTLLIVALLWSGYLEVWQIAIAVGLGALCNAFQMPAYTASVTLLVPKEHLARTGGLIQISDAAGMIIAPLLAGGLIGIIGLPGIILIDVATFLIAAATLLIVRFPPVPRATTSDAPTDSLWREAAYGWRYIAGRAGLRALLIFFVLINFIMGFVNVLLLPLVLSFASAGTLGIIMSIFGGGMLAGSLAVSVWGGPRRRVQGVLGFGVVGGTGLIIAGLRPSIPLLAIGFALLAVGVPIVNACSQAIWQSKVAPVVQGRVFATRRMIAWSMLPVSYLLAGPLADHVFEPPLRPGGAWATTIGALIGVGDGRGIGLLFVVLGVMLTACSIGGYLYPRLRRIEDELPDAIPEPPGVVTHAPERGEPLPA